MVLTWETKVAAAADAGAAADVAETNWKHKVTLDWGDLNIIVIRTITKKIKLHFAKDKYPVI